MISRSSWTTLPFQEFAGLNASLELFFELGQAEVVAHTARLSDRVLDWAERNGIEAATPREPAHRAGIVALRLPDAAARSERLQAGGVTHSLREGAIRLAPYFFNTQGEIDTALEILGKA
jgi:selenocysteine lyase/cysteine desulfurase